ncbi:B2 protein [Hibiscus syriacus]|uniref:B2 protein n=1 Tax=Hibiscus syriacus TaxID=106335 RepID=A0A6A3CHN0_HIBSY|nr:B2 protein [Hibiscus syriacus]
MENNQQSFWQPDERRNFDIRLAEVNSVYNLKPKPSDFNSFNNDGWKIGVGSIQNNMGFGPIAPMGSQKNTGMNGGFNKGFYSKPVNSNNFNVNPKGNKNKGEDDHGAKAGRTVTRITITAATTMKVPTRGLRHCRHRRLCRGMKLSVGISLSATTIPCRRISGDSSLPNCLTITASLEKFASTLPRFIRAITPGLPLFPYNYSTHQLHGIFEVLSLRFVEIMTCCKLWRSKLDPAAWEDKKCPGESRFPAQVQVLTRKICEPLEEESFRPILHHYDGPKFRLELNVPEALSLLDIFAEQEP